jgi:hypothetical protein
MTQDYIAMTSADMLTALGDDGQKWAKAFIQIIDKIGRDKIDEGFMIGWFANAIEHSNAVRRWRREAEARTDT